jgi:Protein of unknown function (DUF2750)
MTQVQEQDEVLWAQFIDESIESDCVYMLVDADTNYAVLTPEWAKGEEEMPVYFAFSNKKLADLAVANGFDDCSIVALEHEHFLQFLQELHNDDMGIMLNPHAPDMMGEEYDAGDVYNELGEAWEMFED